jgi:hypothetical protein
MHKKILSSDYNPETGISTVTLVDQWGTHTATAKLHPEDSDVANMWDGCAAAHYKAELKSMKKKIKAMRERKRGAEILFNNLAENTLPDDATLARAKRQVEVMGRELSLLQGQYHDMKHNYHAVIEHSLNGKREFRKKMTDKENVDE